MKATLNEKLPGRFLNATLLFFNYLMTEFGHTLAQKTNARIFILSRESCQGLISAAGSKRRERAVFIGEKGAIKARRPLMRQM
jgi:hypothetical protein